MFDINHVLRQLAGRFPPETISNSIQSLVKRGILEQYTDEDGDFKFQLTDLGLACGKELFKDLDLFDGLDEVDGMG